VQKLEGGIPDFEHFSGSLLFLKCIGLFNPAYYNRKCKRKK